MSMLDNVVKQIGECFRSPIETDRRIWLKCVCDDCAGYGKREYTLDGINFVTQSCKKCDGTGEMRYQSEGGSDVVLMGSHDRA